jgi:hypothetical protein
MTIDSSTISSPDIRTIAIVDNIHSSERGIPCCEAEIAGFKTISISPDLEDSEEDSCFYPGPCSSHQSAHID